MADKKISQLSSATTPLAGTEVLPIVQSGSTVKVSSDNLTVKNVRSNATTGILQVAGPAAASTRTMTVPDANFTAARTDAAQTFTGDQTFSTVKATTVDTNVAAAKLTISGTDIVAGGSDTNVNVGVTPKGSGYVIMTRAQIPSAGVARFYRADNAIYTDLYNTTGASGGFVLNNANGDGFSFQSAGNNHVQINSSGSVAIKVAGQGIDFSATAGTGTSELLADYEEGTWTPALEGDGGSAGSIAYTSSGIYTKVGRQVTIRGNVNVTVASSWTGRVFITGVPFAGGGGTYYGAMWGSDVTLSNAFTCTSLIGSYDNSYVQFAYSTDGAGNGNLAWSTNFSTGQLSFVLTYFV